MEDLSAYGRGLRRSGGNARAVAGKTVRDAPSAHPRLPRRYERRRGETVRIAGCLRIGRLRDSQTHRNGRSAQRTAACGATLREGGGNLGGATRNEIGRASCTER